MNHLPNSFMYPNLNWCASDASSYTDLASPLRRQIIFPRPALAADAESTGGDLHYIVRTRPWFFIELDGVLTAVQIFR